MQTPSIFHKYRDEVNVEIKAVLDEHESPLCGMMRYHLGWMDETGKPVQAAAGKMMRPTLCLLAAEAITGEYRQALPAAAAVELLHNFSLIHDDIQDDDRERHHRPTVWAIWGKPQAINAGTSMRILANQALFRLGAQGLRLDKLVKANRLLDLSTLQLLTGQYLDISFEERLDVTIDDYLEMVQGKTASLIACSLELGAMLSCEEEQTDLAFHEFGINLGLAFQITDDFLGIWGAPDTTGKSNGSDIHRKKKSYPVVYALENANGSGRVELERIYRQLAIDDSAVDTVLEIFEAAGAQRQTQQAAGLYLERARQALRTVGLTGWGRENFDAVIDFLSDRTF